MKIQPKDLYKLIQKNNYKSVRIYEGIIKDNLSENMSFEAVFCETPQELINNLTELESILAGPYTLALGNGSKTQKISHCNRIEVEFSRVTILKPETNQTYEPTDKIEERINLAVELRLKEIEQENKYKDLEKKLEELETWGGKLNYLLSNFLNTYLQNSMSGATMQGFTSDPQQPQHNPANNNIPADITELEKSLAIITHFLGKENVIKMAKKIQSGKANPVKPIIINFINT